ncbi:hypothetical protein [Cryobacterium sp. W22_MBD10_FK3]|uniref:hypothetical protein n=1 Tax=Cryobacterium sp. W22_MBD10_FK3 TaxID=3240273 RepID=UPI003F8F48D8
MSADGVEAAGPPGGPIPGRPGPRPTPSAPAPAPTEDTPAPPVLDGDLDARLAAVEALPLEDRAAAYVKLHDSLRDHLEGGDVPRSKAE